jgi:hypothetical protein
MYVLGLQPQPHQRLPKIRRPRFTASTPRQQAHGNMLWPTAPRDIASCSIPSAIIDLVKAQGYTVDYILETNAIGSQHLSAAWLLRMHFLDSQGSAPQLCNEATISGLQAMWQRKYGADNKFSTSIRPGLEDGETVAFGGLTLICIHLSGFATPHRRAYRVGENIFGAHSIATLAEDMPAHDPVGVRDSQSNEPGSRLLGAWTSLDRILSLPGNTRVWRSVCT